MQETIYVLKDCHGRPRYVGRTAMSLHEKLANYRHQRSNPRPVYRWLQSEPGATIEALEHLPDGDDRRPGKSRERHWIRKMVADGHDLINVIHVGREN